MNLSEVSSAETETESDQSPPQSASASAEEARVIKSGEDDEAEVEVEEECVLQFLDSLDAYLTLVDSLSSSLRQGWFDLASARQSMGHTRVSSKLFDHKVHSASTTMKVTEARSENLSDPNPQFSLSKWATTKERPMSEVQDNSNLRHRGPTGVIEHAEKPNATEAEVQATDDTSKDIQRERSKSLAIFGALVSPKLRTAQASFEIALEKIVEIANARSTMLYYFSQLQLLKRKSLS